MEILYDKTVRLKAQPGKPQEATITLRVVGLGVDDEIALIGLRGKPLALKPIEGETDIVSMDDIDRLLFSIRPAVEARMNSARAAGFKEGQEKAMGLFAGKGPEIEREEIIDAEFELEGADKGENPA
ncbi:MAG: hypothetical protein M0Z67_10055 [Nitrospiraceae bacterium]|nr:hypothetical protein [Nitrospiraceae bacterium]